MLSRSLTNLSQKRPDLDSGIFSYAAAAFGPLGEFISGWAYWLSAWLGNIAFATIMMSALGTFFPSLFANGQNLFSSKMVSAILLDADFCDSGDWRQRLSFRRLCGAVSSDLQSQSIAGRSGSDDIGGGNMAIVINIDVMLAKRKMSVTELSEKVGITMANISILKNGKAKAIKISTLNEICRVLHCQPGDILEYVKDIETE